MSTACAYRDGNMNGPMYDSTGKVCSTMNGKTKILLIAGCSAAGAALIGLGIYWLIRRSRMASRARRDQSEIVPARPLSAWVGGARPGSMMATSGGGGMGYDPEYAQRERRGTDASSSTGYTGKGSDGSPVTGYAPVGLALKGDDELYANPYGGVPQQQQGQQQQQRRSFYDSPAQGAARGLPIPPAATSTRRYSQQQQPQYQEGAQDVYYYNDDQERTRSRSPSPVGGYSAGGAYGGAPASPSAFYPQAGVHEAYERVELGDEYRERVEMLVPEHRFIQPGR